MSTYDDLLSAITADAIGEGGPGVIVNQFVVVASFMDADGLGHVYSNTMANQRCHETLGLLAFATAIESAHAASPGDDDD